jgi:hydrogenase expression/formation protein HypE
LDPKLFEVGKLPMEFLQDLLGRYGGRDERLVIGPRVGEDAAVLDFGERYLVVKSDPITFATGQIGWYVVHVNANDLATMGAVPRWLLLTLLLPERHTGPALVEEILSQVSQACKELGIVLCGGHTEVTYGLERPIAVGLLLGEVEKPDLVSTSGGEVGDELILTKGIAIEGTLVLAQEKRDQLEARVGADLVDRALDFLHDPGISVVQDAQIVCSVGHPHAMHDPTEGGVATGLWEMAHASGRGIVVDAAQIPVLEETQAFCQALDLDPLGVMASGALLVAAAPEESAAMVDALNAAGIGARIIGRVVDGPPEAQLRTPEGLVPLPRYDRDELGRLFETRA